MKSFFSLWVLLLATLSLQAQNMDSVMFKNISDEVMLHGTCYTNLHNLCKNVGQRLAGSPAAAKAVKWGEKTMKAAGADKVWLQPVYVPHWVRGKENLKIQIGQGNQYQNVPMLSLGNSKGTNGKVLQAPVIMVKNLDEFKNLPNDKLKGKIVFFNYRFRQDYISTGHAYGDAVKYRWATASIAAAKGCKGVIIRSVSSGEDNYPHTGSMRYVDSIEKIPALAIGNYSADTLEAAFSEGKAVNAQIQSEAEMKTDSVLSYNVIGEIKGSEHPEQIIVVGGHLDSWDVGEGANDDGTGCVQAIEVLRSFKALGWQPKYTVRAVLFMNEENGNRGGIAYADSAIAKNEQHILAIESDGGGSSPRGFGLEMPIQAKEKILLYKDLFLPYGVYDFSHEEGGTDIDPLRKTGVPAVGLYVDPQRYFDVHHTNNDVFEHVNHRELKLGAVAMAQLIYITSEHGLK